MSYIKILGAAFAVSLLINPIALADSVIISDTPAETSITAYQRAVSLFQETHHLSLPAGPQIINITKLPNSILPESIMLDGGDGLHINSFSYAPSDVTPQGLLAKLVGQTIGWATLDPKSGKETIRQGRLVSVTGGIILKFSGGIEIDPPGHPVLSDWPENAMLGNGVRISANAVGGDSPLSLGYLAGGLNWQATYVIMLESEGNSARLDGQMSLTNQTGRDFKQAKIRLVAGHINMQSSRPMKLGLEMASTRMADAISESPAFDTHIYNLEGRYDMDNGTMLAIPFIISDHLQIRKRYILEGYASGHPAPSGDAGQFVAPEIRFSFKNEKAAGLGKALPAGIVRVMALQDGVPMLLGEDRITHTPEGEVINLRTGRAFDVTAKRKQVSFKAGNDRSNFESSYEITLKNTKLTGVVVDVVERFPGKWKIVKESMRHVKRDVATAVWSVSVPAQGSVILSYSMKTHR